jgi:Cu-processing system permease protein
VLFRILAIALNTYREAVRARVLHGLLGAAIATSAYSIVLGTLSLHQDARVVADIGSASASLYAALVSIVLGATSLHREVELKTVFPILTRRLQRHEYVLGKYVGMLLTLGVFIALDGAFVLCILAALAGRAPSAMALALGGCTALLAALIYFSDKLSRVFVMIPWALVLLLDAWLLAEPAGNERRLVIASLALSFGEVAIVTAVALLFSSFSSPFLTAMLTLLVFLIGRSADTLANLPARFLGPQVRTIGIALSKVFPNLHLFVPPRPLLLGEVESAPLGSYVLHASGTALAYAFVLLALSAAIFRKRDFE